MISYLQNFVEFFKAGGPLMIPLCALCVYIYYAGFGMYFRLAPYLKICADAESFKREFKEVLDTETNLSLPMQIRLKNGFDIVRRRMLSGIDRRLKMLKSLSAAAPLLGLLGTVSGMMICIGASAQGGSERLVAEGISKALITTQTGLCIAIPAMMLALAVQARVQNILINLMRLENSMLEREAEHGS